MRLAILVVFLMPFLITTAKAQQAAFVVAHRGASYDAPENTLPAFQLAWKQNADAIEGDFYLTKDKKIVCIHDETTGAYSDQNLVVAESTLAELKRLDVGKYKHEKFSGAVIPTLAEVLQTVPRGKKIFIEIKCGPKIVPHLEKVVDESGLRAQQITVISFDADVIRAIKKSRPEFQANWLVSFKEEDRQWQPSTNKVLETLKACRADGLGSSKNTTGEIIDAVKSSGFGFHVWTINDGAQAKQFAQWGAQSITTDRPGLIRSALAK